MAGTTAAANTILRDDSEQPLVLIADDDLGMRFLISEALSLAGFASVEACDGRAAVDLYRQRCPDAVLMDVMMPGKSGLDLLVKLRSSPRWSDLSVIVVTGNDRVLEDHGKSYLSSHKGLRGPDAELGKPVDPEELLRVLETRAPMR